MSDSVRRYNLGDERVRFDFLAQPVTGSIESDQISPNFFPCDRKWLQDECELLDEFTLHLSGLLDEQDDGIDDAAHGDDTDGLEQFSRVGIGSECGANQRHKCEKKGEEQAFRAGAADLDAFAYGLFVGCCKIQPQIG